MDWRSDSKDSSNAEQVPKPSIDEIIERTRKKYEIPTSIPEYKEEIKKSKVSLLGLFHVFKQVSKEVFEYSPLMSPPRKLTKSPQGKQLDQEGSLLDECSIFTLDATLIQEPDQPRNFEVHNFYKLNSIDSLKKLNEIITCFAMNQSHIIIGTDVGSILEYNLLDGSQVASSKIKKQKINTIDISEDGLIYALGTEEGEISIRSTKGSWGSASNSELAGGMQVDRIKFFNAREFIVLANNKIYRVKVKRLNVLKVVLTISHIVQVQFDPAPEYLPRKFELLNEKPRMLLAAATSAAVHFMSINEKDVKQEYVFKRPSDVSKAEIPHFFSLNFNHLFAIFWGKEMHIVKKLKISDDEICDGDYSVLETTQLGFRFDWVGFISEVGLIFLNQLNNTVTVAGIGYFSKIISKGGYYDAETRKISLVQYMGEDVGAILSNIDNKKLQFDDGSIVLETNNNFKKIVLVEDQKLINSYVESGDWHHAIKIAVKMFAKNLVNQKNRSNLRFNIQTICKKYIGYFLKKYEITSSIMIEDESFDDVSELRLKLILQTLLVSDNVDYVFENMRTNLKPWPFWRAMGKILENNSTLTINMKYLDEHAAALPDAQIEKIIKQSYFDPEDALSKEKMSEICYRFVMALGSKSNWKLLFKLSIQFPESCVISLFLNLLLEPAVPSSLIPSTEMRTPLLNAEFVVRLYESDQYLKEAFETNPMLTPCIRLFYYIRKLLHAHEVAYSKTKVFIWRELFQWLLDKDTLRKVVKINLNLLFEVFCEVFLKSEMILNQDFLQDFQRSIKKASSLADYTPLDYGTFNKKPARRFEEKELKAYCFRVIKELLDFLKSFLQSEYRDEYTNDLGFFFCKLFGISFFQELVKDNPLYNLSFVKLTIVKPFLPDHYYYFYQIISNGDFETIIMTCINKSLKISPKAVSNEAIEEIVRECNEAKQ